MTRTCDACGEKFEAKRATARYCTATCQKRAKRAEKATGAATRTSAPGLVVLSSPPAEDEARSAGGELAASTERALRDAGRLETWQGRSAVDLARRIDRARLVETGSAYASLHRELRAAMAEATRGANVAKSAVQQRRDELAARRAARRA